MKKVKVEAKLTGPDGDVQRQRVGGGLERRSTDKATERGGEGWTGCSGSGGYMCKSALVIVHSEQIRTNGSETNWSSVAIMGWNCSTGTQVREERAEISL